MNDTDFDTGDLFIQESITNIYNFSFDYSWGQINFEVRPMDRMLMDDDMFCPAPTMAENAGYNLDIEPDDIEASETVTVLWAIG